MLGDVARMLRAPVNTTIITFDIGYASVHYSTSLLYCKYHNIIISRDFSLFHNTPLYVNDIVIPSLSHWSSIHIQAIEGCWGAGIVASLLWWCWRVIIISHIHGRVTLKEWPINSCTTLYILVIVHRCSLCRYCKRVLNKKWKNLTALKYDKTMRKSIR